jgi:predicted permease
MAVVLEVVLPVFAIIACGYLAGRYGIIKGEPTAALNGFVYFVALPALFLVSMARVEVGQILNGPFLLAIGAPQVLLFAVAILGARLFGAGRLGVESLRGLTGVFANTGYMGIPLLQTAYGEAGVLPAVVATVWHGAVVMGLGIVLLEADFSRGAGALRLVGHVLGGVVRSPLILSAAGGLALSALQVPLPSVIATFLDILAAAAAPCALFAMGLFLVGRSVTAGLGEVAWLTAVKLLAAPALTYWLAYEYLAMSGVWAASAVLLSALPTGALVFILAQQYETYTQRATATILVSTVVSVVTLSALFAVLPPV